MNEPKALTNSSEGFWANISRVYGNLELIREASNRIIDYAHKIQAFSTKSNDEKAVRSRYELDLSPVKLLLSDIKKEVNSILSYANVLYPHLENKSAVPRLSRLAHLLLLELNWPDPVLYWKLHEISLSCDMFAQASNRFILNPTKKSIKAAFGIDVGIESAKLKAYLEGYKSNF